MWYLDLSYGVTIPSWEGLGLHTTGLITLSLGIKETPTTLQLLSILASSPRLQSFTLGSSSTIPCDNIDESVAPVPLHHLKVLSLRGGFHRVFQLLRQLDHPEVMDEIALFVSGCTVEDVLGTFGPYVRDYVRRDGRFRDGLGLRVDSAVRKISLELSPIGSEAGSIQKAVFATFSAILQRPFPENTSCVDFVACIPREHVVYFDTNLKTDALLWTVTAMPKLQELHLTNPILGYGSFLQPGPDGPHANEKNFPPLRRLHLEDVILHDTDGWNEIISFLTRQTSGGQGISLTITDACPWHICRGVLKKMESLVEELRVSGPKSDGYCSHGYCSNNGLERE